MPALADWFVNVSVKGAEGLGKALGGIHGMLGKMEEGARMATGAIEATMTRGANAVLGFARAGMQGTTHGERLGLMFQLVHRQIGSLFIPEIDKLTKGLHKLHEWFRNLGGEQQRGIARWIEAAAVTGLVAVILPKVFGGLQLVIGGLKALGVALATGTGGLSVLFQVAGTLIAAVTALGAGALVGSEGLGGLLEPLKPLIEGFAELAAMLMKAIVPALPAIKEGFQAMAAGLGTMVGSLAPELAKLFQEIVPLAVSFGKMFGFALELAGKLLAPLLGVFAELMGLVSDLGSLLGDAFGDVLKGALEGIVWIFGQLAEGVKTVVGGVRDIVLAFKDLAAGNFGDALKRLVSGTLDATGVGGTLKAAGVDVGGLIGKPGKKEADQPEAKAKPKEPRRELTPAGGQFEGLQESYRRVLQTALKIDKDPAVGELEKANTWLEMIADKLGLVAPKPEVVGGDWGPV